MKSFVPKLFVAKPLQRSHCKVTSFFLILNSSLFVSHKNSNSLISLWQVFNISSQMWSILRLKAIFPGTDRKNLWYLFFCLVALSYFGGMAIYRKINRLFYVLSAQKYWGIYHLKIYVVYLKIMKKIKKKIKKLYTKIILNHLKF